MYTFRNLQSDIAQMKDSDLDKPVEVGFHTGVMRVHRMTAPAPGEIEDNSSITHLLDTCHS